MTRPAEHRTAEQYKCQWPECGRPFHAHYQGHRLFCGNPCRGAFNSHRHQRLRELEDAAYFNTMTQRQIAAGLAALHVEPQLWDETTTEPTP
ncbi:hypothetical protein [Agromyces sp. SYSU T0242]|uniref:hypothetical protein n=1 Tax=Agromyces litoreus TaxID=3158561 RepID=UPI00339A48A9